MSMPVEPLRRLPAFVVLLWSLIASPGAAQAQGIDRELARAWLAEAEAMARADGGSAWGVELEGPLLFIDRGTRAVLANLPDTAGVLKEDAGLYTGTWPQNLPIFNGAFAWGGRLWTMLAWPLPYGRYEGRRLLAHELFHRVQPTLGHPGLNPSNDHLDGPEARTWLRLEWRALQDAIAQTGAARHEAVSDALRFRAERHRLYPAGAETERQLEINEGLAEYTGVRIGIPKAARAGWVVRQLENADSRSRGESVVRNFAYVSGAAYGLLLEAADSQWTRNVKANDDLGVLLATAHDLKIRTDTTKLRAGMDRYAGARLIAEEQAREESRLAQQALFRSRFVTDGTLTLTGTERLQYSFDPNAVVPFADGGTVYLTFEVQDDWGTLRVSEGGALVRTVGETRTVIVSAPTSQEGQVVRGAGWELTLSPGWHVAPGGRPVDRAIRPQP
jgi:hypothetical protein